MRKTIILRDYMLSCIETGDADAEWTVIFLHGACCDCRIWRKQMWTISSHVKLLFLDLPAHGLSDGEPLDDVNEMAQLVMDVVHLVGESVILCGHSMGGAIAQTCALRNEGSVKGLVLIGTGARLKVSSQIFEDVESGRGFTHMLYSKSTSEEKTSEANAIFSSVPAEVCYKDMFACNAFDLLDKVHLINQRTLIISGDEDLMTPPKYARFLNDKIKNSELVLVKNAGHMVGWEKPEEVNRAIYLFIKRIMGEPLNAF